MAPTLVSCPLHTYHLLFPPHSPPLTPPPTQTTACTVKQVTPEGVEVTIHGSYSGFLPTAHLSDYASMCPVLARSLNKGDTIPRVMYMSDKTVIVSFEMEWHTDTHMRSHIHIYTQSHTHHSVHMRSHSCLCVNAGVHGITCNYICISYNTV